MRLALTKKADYLAPILFILFVFFTPLSPSIKTIFFIAGALITLVTPTYSSYLKKALASPQFISGMLLFAMVILACAWSPAPYALRWEVVCKYSKLLYIPLLAVVFIKPSIRKWALNAYLLSIFITCVVSILKALNIIPSSDPGAVFYNHIITGFMVGFAFYIAGLNMFHTKGLPKLCYAFLCLLYSFQLLFINTGRTGYAVYFILVALLCIQKLTFKKALLGLGLFASIVVVVYTQSPVMQSRVGNLVQDIELMKINNKNTSLGLRVQFHDYAKSLTLKHPIRGVGTSGFKYLFSIDNPVPTWGPKITDPHSQYWMTLCEQGVIGLALLIGFIVTLCVTTLKMEEMRPIGLGLLITFCFSCFSDTILCYSTVGYLLIIVTAMTLGEALEKKEFAFVRLKQASNDEDITAANYALP